MLSVGGSGARSRSKSPGGRDVRERSRSRDMRAPSPARRGVSPAPAQAPVSKSRKYSKEEEEDDDLIYDLDDRQQGSRGADWASTQDRYNDDDDDEEDSDDDQRRRDARYAQHDRPRYATEEDLRSKSSRHDDVRRDDSRSKGYNIPEQFDDDDDFRRSHSSAGRDHQERPGGQTRAASYTMGQSAYEKLPQFQYAAVDPKEIRYVQNNKPQYTRSPSDNGPVYTRNPAAQVTVASSRHGRNPSHDGRDAREKDDRYVRSDGRGLSRRDQERLDKEQEELRRLEDRKRQLDLLRREQAEREELELKQKRPKAVQIRDDRNRERERSRERQRDRDVHEIRPRHDHKSSNHDDRDNYDLIRAEKYAVEAYDRKRADGRRRHDDSDETADDDRLERLYHAKYPDEDRFDDRYEDRRDDRRRDKNQRTRPEGSRRESDNKRNNAQVVQIHPGGGRPGQSDLSDRTHRLSVSGQNRTGALTLAAPGAGGHARRGSFGAPPGSPLLESYRGTYQSISPMPSPMALAHHPDDSDLSDMDLQLVRRKKQRSSEDDSDLSDEDRLRKERRPKSILKRAQDLGMPSYDPEHDATALARELKGSSPSPEVIIKIIPTLSNESISLLRAEYKKLAKIQGKGINIAKHIKLKLSGNLGKAAYACALGRWESEAHWANFWYQSGSSRRELLIECLFGRSNAEVRAIKDAFTDKRYGDSLVKCMESELKKDKFRVAVLKALEARRDEHPEINMKRVSKDVTDLRKALVSKDGGETAMLDIIVTRSDAHLRTVLQEYEQLYQSNFAREMVKRSKNLVGETLAHILNGVINRPVRDALLLHQAIAETSKDRAELIISRLVRLHWVSKHFERVKVEYANRYPSRLEYDIEDGTKGDFTGFCLALCRGAVR